MIAEHLNRVIEVPGEFKPKQKKPYPSDNEIPFEEWFFNHYKPSENKSERFYLPILWTAFYTNHKHGRSSREMFKLSQFIGTLRKDRNYFTVVQYDDGVITNLKGLDVKIFGLGCPGHVQLPLVSNPHKYRFKENERPILASFVGSITHPMRDEIIKECEGKEDFFISTEQTSLHSYCYILSQSRYVLCPRGYGMTSFRIAEAIQYGATPVYISDRFLYHRGCLVFHDVPEAIRFIEENPNPKPINGLFNEAYSYEAVEKMIYENLCMM